jgi:hypothetical protein
MAPVETERNLLFGLLALQVGLIDQGALFAAFAAWTRVKGRALADHLIDRGDLDTDQRGVIEAMVGLHLKEEPGLDPRRPLDPQGPRPSRRPRSRRQPRPSRTRLDRP